MIKQKILKEKNLKQIQKQGKIYFKKNSFKQSHEVSFEFTFKPKTNYILMPSTFDINVKNNIKYKLSVLWNKTQFNNSNIKLIKANNPNTFIKFEDEWNNKNSGGNM
jgi:hypothetical protein